MFSKSALFLPVALPLAVYAQYSATFLPTNAPPQSEQGQTGTNQCGTGFNQTSNCQNVYINSLEDFCLYAPPEPGPGSVIGNTERIEVSWCTKGGRGTRVIPDGTILGAHFVQTPDFVQITGMGNFTNLNIPAGDGGGELDPHGADGNGNPIGGLVFTNQTGTVAQSHEWTQFISDTLFCIRACKDAPGAPALCNHIYDVMGCAWNMPANYDAGVFESCKGDSGEPMGVYGGSTFFQGQPATPPPHPAPASSQCASVSTLNNDVLTTSTSSSATSTITATVTAAGASASSNSTVKTTTLGGTAKPTGGTSQADLQVNPVKMWTLVGVSTVLGGLLMGALGALVA